MSKIKKMLENVKFNIEYALAGGMKGGNEVIEKQEGGNGDKSSIQENVSDKSVWNEALSGKETNQVKEMRDEYYRILKESDKYVVNLSGISRENDDGYADLSKMTASASKKTSNYLDKKLNIYNPTNEKVRVIQDNKKIQLYNSFSATIDELLSNDFDTLLTIERDNFIPRFKLEKYASKIVVRHTDNPEIYDLDIYTTMYASQFGKVDALYISELSKIQNDSSYNTETMDVEKISFVTTGAYACDNNCEFEFTDVSFNGIEVYDGNFVLMFTGKCVKDGVWIGERYKTESVDRKYANNEPKSDTVNVFAIERAIKE